MTALTVSAGAVAGADPLERPAEMARHPESSVLLAVTSAGKRLVAVGERGIVLTSDDNGSSWLQAKVPVSVTLTAVSFPTVTQGWAVGHGGIVLRSDDGGTTWTRQLDGNQGAKLELDAATQAAAASEDPAVQRRLRDASRAADEGLDSPLLDVLFLTAEHGFVVGAYGAILETVDSGKHWRSRREAVDNPRGKHLYKLYADQDTLYIAGEQGALFESTDRGARFSIVTTPYRGTYFGVLDQPGMGVVAYGLRGTAYQSSDRGATWQPLNMGQPLTLTGGLVLADRSAVLVDEAGRVLRRAANEAEFRPLALAQSFSFTGAAAAADGGLVLTGSRGTTRIPPSGLTSYLKP